MKKIPLSCFTCIIVTVLLLFSLNSGVFAATTGKIQGTIIDDSSKEPLPGVNVVIDGTVLGAATDESGYFFIINVPPGTYQLKASMVGYATETKENVRVYVDRTSTIDFGLKTRAVAGEEVTVTAVRVPVPLDVSSTEAYVSGEDVAESSVARFDQMIALQAGVEITSSVEDGEGFQVRGGGIDESVLMIDGMSMQDEMTKIPNLSVSRNLIQDVQILTGGFNAEYGNIRSGLINVITKDGSYNRYSGVLEGRISPAARKHYGVGPYDWNNQWYKTYLGSNWHVWDANATGKQYVGEDQMVGWGDDKYYDHGKYINAYDADLEAETPNPGESYLDAHPYAHRFDGGWNEIGELKPYTRETAIEIFKWEFRGKKYGETPDQMVDIGVGGPIPGIPNTKFYTSHFWNKSFYVVPGPRENSTEMTNTFKVTNRISSNMNLTTNFQYSYIHAAADFQYNNPANLGYVTGDNTNIGNFLGGDNRWDESVASPKIMENYYGQIKFTHTYSPSTYYDITIGIARNFNNQDFIRHRDLTKIKFIDDPELAEAGWKETILTYDPHGGDENYEGSYTSGDAGLPVGRIGLDERPRGNFHVYWSTTGGGPGSNSISQPYNDAANLVQWEAGNQKAFAHISYTALTAKANVVSQINKHNQIKAGIQVDNFHMNYLTYMGIGLRADVPSINYPYLYTKYKVDPYEFNAFIQDKLEWEGLIMNAGLRATVWVPGMDGFDLNPSNYYNSDAWGGYATWKSEGGYVPGEANYEFRNQQTRKIKHKVLLQPRLGISHPITTSSKIFFNYGHFYQRPSYHDMYWICANKGGYGTYGQGILPSPDLAWPKTVSYEIGYSQSIYDQILLQVSGYYKDYTNSSTSLNILSYYEDLDYLALTTNGYRDVRGIELRLERSFGRFINGWVNYNYMIQSRGTTGFNTIYENPVLADDQWSSISQPRVDARPSIRTSLTLRTPVGFGPGPAILGIKPLAEWRLNTIITWRDGGERVYDSGVPYKNWNYVQNIDRTTADMYIRKTIARGASLYINVRNLFNIKYYRTTSQYSQSLRYPWTSPSGNDEYGVHDRYYVQKFARDGYDMWNTLRRDVYFGIRYQF